MTAYVFKFLGGILECKLGDKVVKKSIKTILLGTVAIGFSLGYSNAATLDDVKEQGYLKCGVNQGLTGFSTKNSNDTWVGLDIDFCKGLAASIFGPDFEVKFTPLTAANRLDALSRGDVDVLAGNMTWTTARDTQLGLNFIGVNYYDGQGFMTRDEMKINSVLQLSGASICAISGTTTELNIVDYFKENNLEYNLQLFEKTADAVAAYDAGRCDVYSTDVTALYVRRLELSNPTEHIIIPEVISKEPLGPVVREGDDQWFNIARWSLMAALNAEELGVTSVNIDDMMTSNNPTVQRLLGVTANFGEQMGLQNDWVAQMIRAVGNYGEQYDRNLGVESPLGIARGLNALWLDGGIMYGAPIR